MSARRTVASLCAIVIVVTSDSSSSIVCVTRFSVSASRALVASSITSSLGSVYSARAIPSRCLSPTAQLHTALPDFGVEPVSGVSQVVSEMRSPQCSPDPVIVDLILRESERDVVPHRARDQGDGLRNVRDQAGIAAHDLPRRQSADPDRTRRGLHNPEDGIGKRGLAAPRGADDCKGSARVAA